MQQMESSFLGRDFHSKVRRTEDETWGIALPPAERTKPGGEHRRAGTRRRQREPQPLDLLIF
jgi:hypothetical protein